MPLCGPLFPPSGVARAAEKSWESLHLVSSPQAPPASLPSHLQAGKDSRGGPGSRPGSLCMDQGTPGWSRHGKQELVARGEGASARAGTLVPHVPVCLDGGGDTWGRQGSPEDRQEYSHEPKAPACGRGTGPGWGRGVGAWGSRGGSAPANRQGAGLRAEWARGGPDPPVGATLPPLTGAAVGLLAFPAWGCPPIQAGLYVVEGGRVHPCPRLHPRPSRSHDLHPALGGTPRPVALPPPP